MGLRFYFNSVLAVAWLSVFCVPDVGLLSVSVAFHGHTCLPFSINACYKIRNLRVLK